MYDLLIKNGKYPDFEKGEFVSADIAVKDGKIAAILPENSGDAQAAEDASSEVNLINVYEKIEVPEKEETAPFLLA